MAVVKFFFGDDIRRWTAPEGFALADVAGKVRDLYSISEAKKIVMKYTDVDGDLVTLGCEGDVKELHRQGLPMVRIHVTKEAPKAKKAAKLAESSDEADVFKLPRAKGKLTRLVGALETDEGAMEIIVRLLKKAEAADCDSRSNFAKHARELLASRPAARMRFAALAANPEAFGLSRDADAGAVKIAAEVSAVPEHAVVAQAEGYLSSDSENEAGKWRPRRIEKYLKRLSDLLSSMTSADRPDSARKAVKMLAKGAWKADSEGRQRIITCISQAAAANLAADKFLSVLATNPEVFGARGSYAAQRLVAEATGAPVMHPGVTCDGCNVCPLTGKRYKSSDREDYDLCEECFAAKAGDESFTVILYPDFEGHLHRHGGNLGGHGYCRGRGRMNHHAGRGSGWRRHLWGPQGNFLDNQQKPQLRLVTDITVPDDTKLRPGQQFTKVWRVRNSSNLPWDPNGQGLVLVHVGGDNLGAGAKTAQCPIGAPKPGEEVDLSINLQAPSEPGRYVAYFRLALNAEPEPERFGCRIWCQVMVVSPGTMEGGGPLAPDTALDSGVTLFDGIAGLKPLAADPQVAAVKADVKDMSHVYPAIADNGEWVKLAFPNQE